MRQRFKTHAAGREEDLNEQKVERGKESQVQRRPSSPCLHERKRSMPSYRRGRKGRKGGEDLMGRKLEKKRGPGVEVLGL